MKNFKVWFEQTFAKGTQARKSLGVGLIILGALALITPFIPGAGLIIVGFGLLGAQVSLWRRFKSKFI
jgi:hypothetical protein